MDHLHIHYGFRDVETEAAVCTTHHDEYFELPTFFITGTAVAQWVRCCAINRKVAGSIPDAVIEILH